METVKILHCADLHIGAREAALGEKSLARKAEALITFENIVKLAKEQSVDLLLIAGDLFCSNATEYSSVSRVIDCIAAGNIRTVYARIHQQCDITVRPVGTGGIGQHQGTGTGARARPGGCYG